MKPTFTGTFNQMGLRPPGFTPEIPNTVALPMMIAQASAQASQQISREIRQAAVQPSLDFNQALQRDMARRARQEDIEEIKEDVANIAIDQDVDPGSPQARNADENQPLLQPVQANVQQIIDAQPPGPGRNILQENIDRIPGLISTQGFLENREKIQDVGQKLWEWFFTHPKETTDPPKPFDFEKPVFDEKAIPPHCRIQYFWDESKQKLERIMICNDERRNERVYYGV